MKIISILTENSSKEHFSIQDCCTALSVNRSSFYKYKNYIPSKTKSENSILKQTLIKIINETSYYLGAKKLSSIVSKKFNTKISHGKVSYMLRQIKAEASISNKDNPSIKNLKENSKLFKPKNQNLVNQNFNPKSKNQIWVADFSLVKIKKEKYYILVIIDLFSRLVCAWGINKTENTKFLKKVFMNAFIKRNKPSNLIFHSDCGSQFTSYDFSNFLKNLGIKQSFSRKAYPYDNAVIECFFKYLKKECLNKINCQTLLELRKELKKYINFFYNSKRPHSALNYLSPLEKDNM